MRKIFMTVLLAAAAATAQAGGAAWVTCGYSAQGVQNTGEAPILHISYSTAGDAGTPGLFYLGVLSPDQKTGAVMTGQGWTAYQGGLYPFQARYDAGLPGSITFSIPFPGYDLSTGSWAGYSIYAGHGAFNQQGMQAVQSRRAGLNEMKPIRVKNGTWRAEYDSDEQFILSVIQKNMTDGGKYAALITVPYIDCTPLPPDNGGYIK